MALVFAVAAALKPATASAQSSAYAAISGTITASTGQPIAQATVTLTPVGGGRSTETTTSGSGAFAIRLVRPGSYELRIEALGYRPLLAQGLALAGGDAPTVDLSLTAEPPPVMTVDTVIVSATTSGRRSGGVERFGDRLIGSIPFRSNDLASVVSLSTAFDESLGSMGMPTSETIITADGVPFYRAAHPTAREERQPAPLFSTAVLGSVLASEVATEIEWDGAAGGYVSLTTAAPTETAIEVGGFYSGDAVWSSGTLDFDAPALLSYEGTVRATVPFAQGRTQLVVAGDVLEHQTPTSPRLSEDVAADFSSFDPDFLRRLVDPGVETYSRYAGLARLDVQGGGSGTGFVRAVGAFTKRSFEGAGPWQAGATALADASTDLSVAGAYVTEVSSSTTFEVRGGFSGSYRDFGEGALGAEPAYLVDRGTLLGNPPFAVGTSSRSDLVLTPLARFASSVGALKTGLVLRVSRYTMGRGADRPLFAYSDATALIADRGYVESLTVPEASFGTQEYGIFAQLEESVTTGLSVRIGARVDLERIGSDAAPLNEGSQYWRTTSGLSSNDYPTSFTQLALSGDMAWEPATSGRTRVTLAASLREGHVDPRAIGEVRAGAVDGRSSRFAGTGLDWPPGTIPAAAEDLPTLTLFGPDTRAPRTTTVTLGVVQRMTSALSLYLQGSSRRTDFLLRRRDLNLPVVAAASDPNGRDVHGTLVQDGTLVTATGGDARRFGDFGAVWALDPDGWSEYRAATVGFDYATGRLEVVGSYTYSETTDNWVGASNGSDGGRLDPGVPDRPEATPWSVGTSDFDVPQRLAAGLTFYFGAAEVSGLYRFRSGRPFTPGYRIGVDANGDGSVFNDVAFVPTDVSLLSTDWPCLAEQVDGFAIRNSCRVPAEHTVNARVSVRFDVLGGRTARLIVDALNLVESSSGVIDRALLLVDPSGAVMTSPDGSTVTVPTLLNGGFGDVLHPTSRGRMLRIGLRIGG